MIERKAQQTPNLPRLVQTDSTLRPTPTGSPPRAGFLLPSGDTATPQRPGICPRCPRQKTVCPRYDRGQIFSMLTRGYERFWGLSPVSPTKNIKGGKEVPNAVTF